LRIKPIKDLRDFLNSKVLEYNNGDFITEDPISIPKRYTKLQDIEITAFWTAMLSWGQRKTIINKADELFALMGDSPHDFILNHKPHDRKRFSAFKHRTFLEPDTYYFLEFFQWFYSHNESLESAFIPSNEKTSMRERLIYFHNLFFSLAGGPIRTRKHVSSPARKSACKRLNMFLRWMVRSDNAGVDFGLWKKIESSELLCPLDVHVSRVGRKLKMITRKQDDWSTVEELTAFLRLLDPSDPVKYDYALFSLGVLADKDIT